MRGVAGCDGASDSRCVLDGAPANASARMCRACGTLCGLRRGGSCGPRSPQGVLAALGGSRVVTTPEGVVSRVSVGGFGAGWPVTGCGARCAGLATG